MAYENMIPIMAAAAIPTTLLTMTQMMQGTSQVLSATGVEGDEAAHRLSLMVTASGAVLIAAAAATSIKQNNPHVVLATALTTAFVLYMYHKISFEGKPAVSPIRKMQENRSKPV